MNMRHHPSTTRRGFTLIELLLVISLMGIIMTLVVPSYLQFLERAEVRREAETFVQSLRTARQIAMDRNQRVRLVFADRELASAATDLDLVPKRSFTTYTFDVPALPQGGSQFMPFSFGSKQEKRLPEFAQMAFVSVPSGFVGQWIPLAEAEGWTTFSEEVEMKPGTNNPSFFNQPVATELPTITGQNRAIWDGPFYFTPDTIWDYTSAESYLPSSPMGRYPQNYHQTPYPQSYSRSATEDMPVEPSRIYSSSQSRYMRYDELWNSNQPLNYFNDIVSHVGDFKETGVVEDRGTANRRFFDLHGIEFNPRGECTWSGGASLSFRFQPDNNTYPWFDVVVDEITGLARIESPRVE